MALRVDLPILTAIEQACQELNGTFPEIRTDSYPCDCIRLLAPTFPYPRPALRPLPAPPGWVPLLVWVEPLLHVAREEVRLNEGVDELASCGLIADCGYKGEVFRVTGEGYRVADLLRQVNAPAVKQHSL